MNRAEIVSHIMLLKDDSPLNHPKEAYAVNIG